jgi:sec-independent protein translocase protein TatA
VFAFILEGLGSTELLFVLAIALIFFGPRKLPQLARSMGKGLAEFRKASDDFKRTWEREVALESVKVEDNSMLEAQPETTSEASPSLDEPVIESPDPEQVVARDDSTQISSEETAEMSPEPVESVDATIQPEPQPIRKQDWL